MGAVQEAIRIVLETEGREGLEALRRSLAGIGDVSAESVADTDRLLDSLAGLNEAAAKATRFEQLSTELAGTTTALDDASRAALQMALQIAETEKPSKAMLRTFKEVRGEVTKLEVVQRQQATAQERLGAELRESGFDTSSLATANQSLRAQVQGATDALQQQVRAVEQQAAASRRQRDATEEADAAFRKMARSGQVSAEALREYRERAAQATRGTRELGGAASKAGGVFSGLRGLVAPVLAYLGFNEAIQGVKNLGDVAAQAENARRALQNLYGSQEAGNRAYETLRDLSKENGIAFDVLVESAKKLKAFGLDPLNGSFQALIDQNAAVGGSNEDLQGKVLALGQAWAKQKLQGEEILQLVERGVPVWDLLQKATGKNVEELQKLSEKGELGRSTIKALYEEIGKANAGKANDALTGMSGLLAQLSARWVDFKQKIIDAGLGDYFKQQMQTLLQATGGLDGLAKRVATSIVGTLEALKGLGQQIALIAKPIGSTATALARHADAIVLLGKVYVGLKLAKWAGQFASLAASMGTATAATTALTAAETARATGLGRLGGMMAKIPRLLTVTFAVVGLDVLLHGIDKLNEGYKAEAEAIAASDKLRRASQSLQQEQLRLGQQLQSLYRSSADTALESGGRVNQMTRDQADGYLVALNNARQFYGGVIREARAANDAQAEAAGTERWKALGAAVTAAKDRLAELARTAASDAGVRAFATKAVEEFDKLIGKAKSAKEATADIFKGIDFGSSAGVKSAIDIIGQIGARGTEAAAAIKAELQTALADVASRDLPALKAAAEQAFGTGTEAAKLFAAEVERINLTRLGVDVDAIKTGFTATGRAAVDAFKGAIEEIDRLGLSAQQRSQAIAQAFDNAFKQAGTKAELQALKAALHDALATGGLEFVEFQKRIAETDAKLAELGSTGKQLGHDVAQGARTAASSLSQVAEAADDAASGTARAGGAARTAAGDMKDASKAGQEFALSLGSVSDKAMAAFAAVTRAQTGIGDSSRRFTTELRRVQDTVNGQNAAIEEQIRQLEAASQATDEYAQLRQSLAVQYDYVGADQINRLVEAERKAAEFAKKRADDTQRASDTQQAAVEAAAQSPRAVDAAAATRPSGGSAGPLLATLRVEIVGGSPVELQVTAASGEDLVAQLMRARSVSTRRRGG